MSPQPATHLAQTPPELADILQRIDAAATAAGHGVVRLLAVSKTKPATAMATLLQGGQTAFGENYVQEAVAKRQALAGMDIEWHLIGPLQSNKCKLAAATFDWIQTVDRLRLIEPLARFRDAAMAPLNVLLQVNIDDEAGKSGCTPDEVPALADAVAAQPRLRLRGLMAIPQPHADLTRRSEAFVAMRALFDRSREAYPQMDTLSMGMSEDFEAAIAAGATMVRIGSALFGSRDRGAAPGPAQSDA